MRNWWNAKTESEKEEFVTFLGMAWLMVCLVIALYFTIPIE